MGQVSESDTLMGNAFCLFSCLPLTAICKPTLLSVQDYESTILF